MTAIDHPKPLVLVPETGSPTDFVRLEVSDLVVDVLTGIYSEETHMPQPLKVSVTADIAAPTRWSPPVTSTSIRRARAPGSCRSIRPLATKPA